MIRTGSELTVRLSGSGLRSRRVIEVATALVTSVLLSIPAAAQAVALRIHPRVGDTLHTRLEQRMDVSSADEGGDPRGRGVSTSVALESRTIVQSSLVTSTIVLTIVDAADVSTTDVHAADQIAAAERMLRGQRLLLQLAMDGSVESARDGTGRPVARDIADAMSAMPAVFPRYPVRVGDQWSREMPVPSVGPLGAATARFRLDSLSRGGRIAFVSMRGDIRPASSTDGVQLTGAITGTMRLDRERGWMIDSQVTVIMHSLVTPPPSSGRAPMRFVTRLTQHLRTMDKR